LGALEDLTAKVVPSMRETDEEKKKAARLLLATETLPFFFEKFEKLLKENGTGFYAGKVNNI
jgi:hypothetical protein